MVQKFLGLFCLLLMLQQCKSQEGEKVEVLQKIRTIDTLISETNKVAIIEKPGLIADFSDKGIIHATAFLVSDTGEIRKLSVTVDNTDEEIIIFSINRNVYYIKQQENDLYIIGGKVFYRNGLNTGVKEDVKLFNACQFTVDNFNKAFHSY
jgi:hypothetical protein